MSICLVGHIYPRVLSQFPFHSPFSFRFDSPSCPYIALHNPYTPVEGTLMSYMGSSSAELRRSRSKLPKSGKSMSCFLASLRPIKGFRVQVCHRDWKTCSLEIWRQRQSGYLPVWVPIAILAPPSETDCLVIQVLNEDRW